MVLVCAELALLEMMLQELCFHPSWDDPDIRVSW
uniref:BLTX508 n=1 Tax=Nephila pilipes TaxID=299642 RepID=A0A076KU41_NEPPI|nr:BLTX508 [Nephila pilipes]